MSGHHPVSFWRLGVMISYITCPIKYLPLSLLLLFGDAFLEILKPSINYYFYHEYPSHYNYIFDWTEDDWCP